DGPITVSLDNFKSQIGKIPPPDRTSHVSCPSHVELTPICVRLAAWKQTPNANEKSALCQKQAYGGAVLCIEESSDIVSSQLASFGRAVGKIIRSELGGFSRRTGEIKGGHRRGTCTS